MAVYTHISNQQFQSLISQYNIGDLVSFKGIAAGVSNTNYIVNTTQNKFIATIYEKRTDVSHLPFYWRLMEHLSADNIPCPLPIHDKKNQIMQLVDEQAFALVSFVDGKSIEKPNSQHCFEIGLAMAKMHISSANFSQHLENPLSIKACNSRFKAIKAKISESFSPQLAQEIQSAFALVLDNLQQQDDLPSGVIHGDLFPDNVFFQNGKLSALIDFYLSCNDLLAYDVAIALNAWCFEHHTEFNITKAKKLLRGYNQQRPFTDAELKALPVLCAGASLRFLISRLDDYINQVDGALVDVKDPMEYLEKLRFHLQVKSHTEYGL